jgi:hypothetical protein
LLISSFLSSSTSLEWSLLYLPFLQDAELDISDDEEFATAQDEPGFLGTCHFFTYVLGCLSLPLIFTEIEAT